MFWVVLKIFTQKIDEHMKGYMIFRTVPSTVRCFAVGVTVRLIQRATQSTQRSLKASFRVQ